MPSVMQALAGCLGCNKANEEANKAYCLAHIKINNKEAFGAFPPKAGPTVAKYNGKFLVKSPTPDVRENNQGANKGMTALIEFPALKDAIAWYESKDYGEARAIREKCSDTDLVLCEGLSPQVSDAAGKGYCIARINIKDKDAFSAFPPKAGPIVAQFGGRFLMRSPQPDVRESVQGGSGFLAVIEFPTLAKAVQFYESPGYTEARLVREKCSSADLMLVEGSAA